MSNLVPFESGNLPAYLQNRAPVVNDLGANVGGGFPVMSIKGKVFTMVKGGVRTLLRNPNDEDAAASSIMVVLLKANSGLSKVWYANGYVEGSTEAPDCFSHDGIAPDPAAEHKQANKCVGCPKNVWGSKISDGGQKLKACADSRRVAIADLDNLNDPILLRVPAATLKPLADYGAMLASRQAPYNAVLTKIGFDPESASPKLTFKPAGWLTDAQFRQVEEVVAGDVVADILGVTGVVPVGDGAAELDAGSPPAGAVAPAAAPAPRPRAAKPTPAPAAAAAAAPAPAPVAAAPAPAPTPAPVVTTDNLEADLDSMLDGLDD